MHQAVKINDILRSSRLSLLDLDRDAELDKWLLCPSCETHLIPVCILTNGLDQKVRYGLCETCGYMGYMDRPSKNWMISFYSKDWDRAYPKTIVDIQLGTILPKKGIKPSRYLAASLVDSMSLDKERSVCEMGSGYGEVLKYFKDKGFKNIVGVENSKHRASLVQEALGINVLHGEFENQMVQEELLKRKPIGLIFSHHVLEHVYDPSEIIGKISSLQSEGDHLILSLPNADGEHINYALLYLVHLHSFTKESLELLLNKHGYEIIVDNSPDNLNIIIGAKKTAHPIRKFKTRQDYALTIENRIRKGFALDSIKTGRSYKLYWVQGLERDGARISPILHNPFLQKIDWVVKNIIALVKSRLFKKFTSGYTMLITPMSTSEKCFEISYPNNVKFLIK